MECRVRGRQGYTLKVLKSAPLPLLLALLSLPLQTVGRQKLRVQMPHLLPVSGRLKKSDSQTGSLTVVGEYVDFDA